MVEPLDVGNRLIARRVVAIQRAAFAVEAELIGFDGIPPLHESVADVQARTNLEWLGSHEDEALVGIVGWSIVDGVVDIDRLAIDPSFARKGHGSALLAALPPVRAMKVSTGAANRPARAFYERYGFRWNRDREVVPGLMISDYEFTV